MAYSDDVTVIDNVDWSENGFENVKITYHHYTTNQLSRNSSIENLLTLEIDFVIAKTNNVIHFERIGSIGLMVSCGNENF